MQQTDRFKLDGKLTHFHNPRAHKSLSYGADLKEILSISKSKDTIQDIKTWPQYQATPLFELSSLARTVGVEKIWYKDESERFGIKSFKALGGAYAVARQLQHAIEQKTGVRPTTNELLTGKVSAQVSEIVITCATDGNHGRSVAWGAQLFGCGCVIYIHSDVSKGRERAMAEFGAAVIRVDGNYDESVRQADADAKTYNRIIVSDTSYEGYMEIPKDVALGYTVMLSEVVEQLNGEIPSHVFIQGGVGGLASTICGYFWELWGSERPRVVIVEPIKANCLQESARAGKPVVVEGDLDTMMAGLACGEVSALAWTILEKGADDFLTLSEEAIPTIMRLLANGYKSDPMIEAGESAVPGLAAALIAKNDLELSAALCINSGSKVLVFGTEGATDPDLYKEIVG